ncbi:Uncharacterised protein [Escherichia coli]|nr:Uncharacterised protein [Escherichia coli]
MVAIAATGTVLNAVSARKRVEPEHGGGDCEHCHQTGGRTGKAVLQKAGERVYIPIYRLISLVLADRSFMKQ